jgi:soluble lytic murein transglycosylase
MAAAHYRTLIKAYSHYFYAQMARERLVALGDAAPVSVPHLDKYVPGDSQAGCDVPEGDPHLVKAHLLVNAGLSEYVPQEIARAGQLVVERDCRGADLCLVRRDLPRHARAEAGAAVCGFRADQVRFRWLLAHSLSRRSYWDTIKAESAKNGLDPYFVASLIRQESEFNPSAISHANAYGLMQLLPRWASRWRAKRVWVRSIRGSCWIRS